MNTPSPTMLIAHRGESEDVPENTLPAYRTAVERGFGFECDCYLSADRKVFTFNAATCRAVKEAMPAFTAYLLMSSRHWENGPWGDQAAPPTRFQAAASPAKPRGTRCACRSFSRQEIRHTGKGDRPRDDGCARGGNAR